MSPLVHRLTLYLAILAVVQTLAVVFALWLLVQQLPTDPSPALVGLLSGVTTGLVGAIGVVVGALAGAYVSLASFRSVRQAQGHSEGPDTGSGPGE